MIYWQGNDASVRQTQTKDPGRAHWEMNFLLSWFVLSFGLFLEAIANRFNMSCECHHIIQHLLGLKLKLLFPYKCTSAEKV